MKTYVVAVGVVITVLAGFCGWASHVPRQLEGFARASAETAANRVVNAIPDEIHDRKLDNEVSTVRQEITDLQIQMNLSQRQVDQLRTDVDHLQERVERRKRLLIEAYPILKTATDHQQKTVTFANQEYSLSDFQKEVDELLSVQNHETRQVEIKRAALVRLQNSVEQSEISVSEMKRAVDQTEQEVAVLRYRREHADVESQTLDLISSSTAKRETVGAVMNDGITRLKGNVNQLEARNETRRGRMSLDQRPSSNAVSRQWDRLESLKMIHDEALPDADRQSAETLERPQD